MRQLVRAVVATAALLGVLGLPTPVAAETAEQCQATLNAYRAKAGLAKASTTSTPALGVAAGRHAGYRVNVDPGDSIVLSQLGLPDLGLFGPDLTAHLETPSLVKLGFTGVNPWDRTRAAKLADGTWRYQYEDVTTATNIPAAQLQGVRSWVDAPYHRLPLMDANTRHIGCSASQRTVGGRTYSAEVLEMAATWKAPPAGSPSTRPAARPASPPRSTAARSTPPPSAAPATRPTRSRTSAASSPSRPTATTP